MRKLAYLFLLLAGCEVSGNQAVLSISPLTSFVPVQGANELTYPETDTIQVNGLIGSWKLVLENKSDTDLTEVKLIVTANDPNKIGQELIFARIYKELFSGGSIFAYDGPPELPDGSLIYPAKRHDGLYAIINSWDLPAGSRVQFDSLVLGEVGLALHFEAYATMGDHYALSFGNEEASVIYQY